MAFYYQEMASAKDKVTETTDTTAETEVKEVGGKVDKCYGDRLYGQFFLGRWDPERGVKEKLGTK